MQASETTRATIRECLQCGSQSDKRCTRCKLTYYCSKECLKAQWSSHKIECKVLRWASCGSIKYLKLATDNYLQEAQKTPCIRPKKRIITRAIFFHQVRLARMIQDIACYKNQELVADCIESATHDYGNMLIYLLDNKLYTPQEIKDISRDLATEAIAWVKERTQNNEITFPFEIRQLAREKPNTPDLTKEFIPQYSWKKARLKALDELEQDILASY